jgi:tetratricopeptide (TPR) repeat protein
METLNNKFSWYEMTEDVKQLLFLASQNWENTEVSEQYIKEALKKTDNNLDILIGAYRFFFYKNKPEVALQIANQVLKIIEKEKNLPKTWAELEPILVNQKEDPTIRLYLNAYASTSYLLAKMGKIEEAKIVSERIKTIDQNREFCATTVFEVLTSPPEEEEY